MVFRFLVTSMAHGFESSVAAGGRADRGPGWAIAAVLAAAMAAGGCEPVLPPDAGIRDAAPEPDEAAPEPDGPLADAMPPCVEACVSEMSLRDCTADGERIVHCPLGCVDADARCRKLVPSNGVTCEHLRDVEAALTIPDGAHVIVDTDVGSITVAGQSLRGPGLGVNNGIGYHHIGEDLSVFAMWGLTMDRGSSLRAHGERPLMILVGGVASIAGTIDVSAGCASGRPPGICGGPGGGRGADGQSPATGCGPGGNGSARHAHRTYGGGGGGAAGEAGAAGGAGQDAAGGGGGEACVVSLTPLRGGSGGGRSGADDLGDDEGAGGGGGGAVQITSYYRIELLSGAVIDAGGGGGARGGGGGGGGGGILLEAPVIKADGAVLAANGGGGGSEFSGEDGLQGVEQAEGGGEGGGFGGALEGDPTAGTLRDAKFGGGGGGAVGLIVLRARANGYKITDTPVSPAQVEIDVETQ